MRARLRGPILPASACVMADSFEMPSAATLSATTTSIPESQRSACRYGGHLPMPRPVPAGLRVAPCPASRASGIAPLYGQTPPTPPRTVLLKHCAGERPPVRDHSRSFAMRLPVSFLRRAGNPATRPADVLLPPPNAPVASQVVWSGLPSFSLCARILCPTPSRRDSSRALRIAVGRYMRPL